MIQPFFSARHAHPLANPREVERLVAALPLDNAFDAIDQVSAALKSLRQAEDLPLISFFEALRQLDEAAQPHLQRLAREYLNSSRASKSEEGRLWTTNYGYWQQAADLYAKCLERFIDSPTGKGGEALRAKLPLVTARLIAARTALLKWLAYHYAPANETLWVELGRSYLVTDALGHAQEPLFLYPDRRTRSTATQQYLRALVLYASSIDCLVPQEIELADRLIEHLLPEFAFSAESQTDSVYWVDAFSGVPPLRLTRQPREITASMRFFSPGAAAQSLASMIEAVTRGEMPASLDLDRSFSAKQLLPVLRHLARYWATQPPLREHPRHGVKNRCSVVHGFGKCHAVLSADRSRESGERGGDADGAESWMVENVSFGGFGAEVDCSSSGWPKLGALLCVQPAGGSNWVLAIVRRYGKRSETSARVGIQSLSRQATAIQLRPHTHSVGAMPGIPGIWLRENDAADGVRLVLPAGSFSQHRELVLIHENTRTLLALIELDEAGSDYQIARCRAHPGS